MNSFMEVDKGFPPKLYIFTKVAPKYEHANISTIAPTMGIILL